MKTDNYSEGVSDTVDKCIKILHEYWTRYRIKKPLMDALEDDFNQLRETQTKRSGANA